jgi:hypothetical protein
LRHERSGTSPRRNPESAAACGWTDARAVKTYTMIATIALLLSFVTPVLALFGIPGPSVAPLDTVIVMILTHIIAFVVSTLIVMRLTRES